MPHRRWLGLALAVMLAAGVAGCWIVDVLKPPAEVTEEYDASKDLFKQQEYARAEVGFKSFLDNHPNNPLAPWARYYLAESYFKQGLYQDAIGTFELFLQETNVPQLIQLARYDLGECYRQVGRVNDARAQYEQVIDAGTNLESDLAKNYIELAKSRLSELSAAPNSAQ